jgi:hypothetical protein
MHYARLSSVLSNVISVNELLAVCSDLQMSSSNLNLPPHSSQQEFVSALSAHLYKQGRFEELYDVLNKLYPQIVHDWLQKRPSQEWLPFVDVPVHVLKKVDKLLGGRRELHFGYEFYDAPTGCYCWPFVIPIAQGVFPELKYKIIERIRVHLRNESVIAFIGHQSFYDIPYIVIAPTTDQLDIIRIAGTCGPTLGVDHGDVVDELQVIDEQYGIDILGADDRAVVFRLKRQILGTERDEFIQWMDIFAEEAIWPVDFREEEYIELIFD